MPKKQLKITVAENGELKIDASKMPGTADKILAELKELAALVGGDVNALVVEKHVHSHGAHTHDHDHAHTHG